MFSQWDCCKSDYNMWIWNFNQPKKGASRTIHERSQDGKGYWWVCVMKFDCDVVFEFWKKYKIHKLRIDDSIKVLMAWCVDARWISIRLKSKNQNTYSSRKQSNNVKCDDEISKFTWQWRLINGNSNRIGKEEDWLGARNYCRQRCMDSVSLGEFRIDAW